MTRPTTFNFPAGTKINGSDISLAYPDAPPDWVNWSGSNGWPWFRKALERIAGMGHNCVRFYVNADAVFLTNSYGNCTTAQVVSEMQQIVAYAVALGLHVYPYTCAQSTYGVASASLIAFAEAVIDGLRSPIDYRNWVIGIDMMNEAGPTSTGSALYSALSVYANLPPEWPLVISCHRSPYNLAGYQDVKDYHYYPTGGPPITGMPSYATETASGTGWLNYNPATDGVDFIIGEYGLGTFDATNIATWCNSLPAFANSDSRLRGYLYWTVQGAVGSATAQFFTNDTPNTEYIRGVINANSPTVSVPNAPANLRLTPDGIKLVWNPVGCTNAYNGTNLYRNATKIVSAQMHGLYDDSASWATKQYAYKATVVDVSANESAATPIVVLPGRLPPKLLRRRVAATFH